MVYNNILEAMGHTPLIKLNHIVPRNAADIYVKFEGLNVGGSIKTRTAYNMILDAEKRGLIDSDTIIVEPTSGNQGIGLALSVRCEDIRLLSLCLTLSARNEENWSSTTVPKSCLSMMPATSVPAFRNASPPLTG